MAVRMNTALKNAILDTGFNTIFDGGTLQIRSGAVPAAVSDPAAGTLLAGITLPADAFAPASGGAVAKQGTWQDTSADATGTAAHFRMVSSDGLKIMDGAITATGGGGDITLDNTSISSGQVVSISSLSISLP